MRSLQTGAPIADSIRLHRAAHHIGWLCGNGFIDAIDAEDLIRCAATTLDPSFDDLGPVMDHLLREIARVELAERLRAANHIRAVIAPMLAARLPKWDVIGMAHYANNLRLTVSEARAIVNEALSDALDRIAVAHAG